MLQIIRYFEFIESIKKSKSVFQTLISKLILAVPKKSCKNLKYMEKG